MKPYLTKLILAGLLIAALLAGCAQGDPTQGGPTQGSDDPTAAATAAVTQAATEAVPTRAPTPAATATAAVPEGYFQNPVLRSNFPDPLLIQEGDTWYAYATNGAGKNVQLATSTDLVHWQLQSDAMPALASWVRLSPSDVWAPEVMKIGDQFVLYYTARHDESGKQCVGRAVSAEPQGKFIDENDEPLVCQVDLGGTIDASPFRDGDKLYLLYKNDGNCCGMPTYLFIQELAPDGLSLVGEARRLIRNDEPWEAHVIEAPTLWVHDGQYYLFYSANNYGGHEYAVGYAVCESPIGPCEKAEENPILKSRMDEKPIVVGPGHQTIVEVNGQTWIVYHVWQMLRSGARSDNRFMWIDRLNWEDGKPVVAGPTTDPQPAPYTEPAQ